MTKTAEATPETEWYQKWRGKVDKELLHLQNTRGKFLLDKVDERILKYYNKNCIDKVWGNHLLLGMLVSVDRKLDALTIMNIINVVNLRLVDIFQSFHLDEIKDFDIDKHLYKYLKGDIFPEDSNSKRNELFKRYTSLSHYTKNWLFRKISAEKQVHFKQFLFDVPTFTSRDFSFNKLSKEQAKDTRKNETDAIVPFLPQIRADAHFRWNQMKRLREAFQKTLEDARSQFVALPTEICYDEPERVGERFYFRLWDKPSFVLHHKDRFPQTVVKLAEERKGTYSEGNNHYFVEFLKAESRDNDDVAGGLWFNELIENGVIGNWDVSGNIETIAQKQNYLSLWGYGDSTRSPLPFYSQHKGILSPSNYISRLKDKAEGSLLDIEPLYVACTFGLLAIDILTTTGARINELLQIKNTKKCIQAKKVKERIHYSFYAVPKGRDEVEEFYVSKQTMELLQLVSRMLKDHYVSPIIPSVEYRHERKHVFPEPKPYYFQYSGKALKHVAVYACIRFLLHGLIFETQEGKPVTIKTHLLRHAFATEAVQRQKMPIDIVAKILHQRDLDVTGYYSAPTPSQIAESVGELQDVISSYVDLDEALLRSPKELQQELDEYNEKVGVFNKVLGGTCVTDYVCPTKMACLGCKAKVPEPEQEGELLEVIKLSKDMEKRYKSLGLDVEVRKAKEMAKQAKIELKEIDLIKKYREERKREAIVNYNTFW